LKVPLRDIARQVGGRVAGDENTPIKGVNSLERAQAGELSYFIGGPYREVLERTKASAVIVAAESDLFQGAQVIAPNPELAYAKAAWLFAPPVPRFPGVSEAALVHKESLVGKDVSIYPMVYVGEGASIGDEVILFPGVFIGDRVKIGKRTVIHPNVSILHDCIIGNDVIIHAGTVVGSDGFGFARDGSRSVKIPQTGFVQIDDDVEIGANNCIDRAALGKTWIKRGVKTDNLVQVGHNVVIGEDTVIVAQVGISGSSSIGREVILAGQVGISDHLEVGDRVMVGAQSGVAKSVPPGEVVTGTPAIPHRTWLRASGLYARLPNIYERLKGLEKRIKTMESRLP